MPNTMRGFAALVIAAALVMCARASAPRWPDVAATEGKVHVIYVANADPNGLEMTIKSPGGAPLYMLTCHNFDHVGGGDLTYSGLMQCYLFPWQRYIGQRNLLDDDTSTPSYQSRARFAKEHVLPDCSGYAEWGAVRHFWLRGMVVTLAVRNLTFSRDPDDPQTLRVETFDFEVRVQPYPGALDERAQRIAEKRPAWFDSNACPPR
ncbi:MAG: hypothetical protein IT548_06235 [Alphaproteobacteria bacterium]|nr:hypothetical protein [Alphaproteobacteria bacterium]